MIEKILPKNILIDKTCAVFNVLYKNKKITNTVNNPDEFLLWFDASDTSTIIKDTNNRVSQWTDKSNSNNNAIQTNDLFKPVTNTDTLNALNTLKFSGIDNRLEVNSIGQNATYFIVYSSDPTQIQQSILGYNATSYIPIAQMGSDSTNVLRFNTTQNDPVNTSILFGNEVTSSTSNRGQAFINLISHNLLILQNAPSFSNTDNKFFIGQALGNYAFKGLIAEIIVLPVSSIEKTNVINYLKTKWQI